MGQLMNAISASTALAIQRTAFLQTQFFWRFFRQVLSAFALCSSALFATSALAQAGLVRWVFDPAIAPTAWLAGDTISIGYNVTSSSQTDAADLVADLRIKRNNDSAFQQTESYKVCVGFDGICSTVITQFSVSSGLLVATVNNVVIPPTAFREGRQLWIRRLVGTDPNVEDATVRTAYLDILPTLPNGPEAPVGCRLDVDGDGSIKRETDGVLLQRYLVGFRDGSLTAGVDISNALRNSYATVNTFLSNQNWALNAEPPRATDVGLTLSRFLGGQPDASLVAGISNITLLDAKNAIAQRLSYVNGRNECAFPLIGVKRFVVGANVPDRIALLTNSSTNAAITFDLSPGAAITDYSIAVESGSAFASVVSSASGPALTVSTMGVAGGSSKWVRLRVTHNLTGRYAVHAIKVDVASQSFGNSGNIASAGGYVTDSQGATVSFGANTLPSPVTVALREGTTSAGQRVIELEFSEDVRGKGLFVKFVRRAPNLLPEGAVAQLLGAKSTPTQANAFDPLTITTPYQGSSNAIGERWLEFTAKSADGYRLPDETPIACDAQLGDVVVSSGRKLRYVEAAVGELRATIPSASPLLSGTEYEPVLFVHGFSPNKIGGANPFGGGQSTWAQFPSLVRYTPAISGKKFVPFEFRWNTNARFRDVAADLIDALNLIRQRTGKPVHIVAHSFGGLLTRSVLQTEANGEPLAVATSQAAAADARNSVASVLTLGTPHSGIGTFGPMEVPGTNTRIPEGQDGALKFNLCGQSSCHEAGEPVALLSDLVRALLDFPVTPALSGNYFGAGGWAGKLADTASTLPAIPIIVGIGLRNDDAWYSSGAFSWLSGDNLISYAGQRFHPNFTGAGTLPGLALKKGVNVTSGPAKLYEVILGTKKDVRPGDLLSLFESVQSPRARGYLHSSNHPKNSDGWIYRDGPGLNNFDYGLMAAPNFSDCQGASAPSTCQHAGWLLFKNLQLGRYCEFTEAGCPAPAITRGRIANTGQHACAVVAGGGVKCWGANTNGALGLSPALVGSAPPTAVVGVSSAIAVSNGSRHSCALISDGTVKCWGDNNYGQLGNGSTIPSFTPVL
jgi:pimeloyl-ACP methyl ester carboxylesterase